MAMLPASKLTFHLAWVPRRQRASTTRTFLSLCAPLRPLQPESFLSAPPEVLRVPTYRNWLNSTGPSILHVDGDYISARQLAEQLFLTHLRGLQKKSDMEKYYRSHAFTFDSADPRRSSVASMIASLLARLYASRCLDKRASQELKNLLHLKNIWNDRFAIAVLDNLRAHFSGPDILFLLQDCDECDSQSWKLFLDYLSGWMERGENGLKIIVTSRKHESLSEAPGWSQILADQSNGSKSLPLPFPRRMSSLMNIVSFGRDAVDIRTKMLKLIREMGKADFCAMMHRFQESVIWHSDSMSNALARLQKLQDAMGPKKSPSETLEDMMRSTVPTDVLRWIISWLLCGVRPLSKRQLIILSILQSHRRESKPSEGTIPYITIAEFNLTWDKLSTWLPTLATYDGSRVFVREEIRDLLKPDTENKPCLWSEVIATAHEELAKFCLQYVCGRRAKTDMRNIFNDYETVDSDHPESSPTETADWNITSLIVQSLPHHLSRCRPDYSNSLLQPILRDSRAKRLTRWARAFWAMRAPLTRPLVAPESAIPVLVEFGLLSEDDVLGLSGELRTQCLVAAAEGGRDDMVTALLDEKTTQGQDLMDTFYAAVRAGNERMALDVGNHIVVSCNGHAEVTYAWPPLSIWSATILGMSGVLGMLLDNGVQPDAAEGLGQTPSPLSMACFLGNHSTTKTLLEHGASASTTDPEGLDCLMAAVASGVVDVVKELLGWDKARLQVKNPHTPLTAAATGGCWKVIQYLLCLGSDPNQTMEGKEFSSRIRTPLAIACANGYVKTTRVLLGARTAGPNTMLPSTISMALYGAAAVGQNPECVRCLLECGADPNHEGLPPLLLEVIRYAKGDGAAAIEIFDMFLGNDPPLDMSETNSRDGETALMRACARGRLALVRWLLERGVDINAVDTRNRSALTHAARSGLVKIVRELLSYKPVLKMDLGSDDIDSLLVATLDYPEILEAVLEGERIPERKPSEFPSALHRAIFYEKLPAARILINKGFDVNTVDDRNMAPIHYAVAFAADASITRLLIDTGADLKVANVEGYTALHLAVCGPTVVMQVLLEYAKHLDLNQRNNKGITPLMMVEKATNNECMKLLIRAGADVNCQNDEGVPPLYLALSFDNRGYVDLLLAQPEIDVNLFSDTRGGPLHRACYNLGVDDVQRLVKRGAVVNLVSKRSVNITTPLITTIITSTLHRRATREWDAPRVERIVRMLVDNGADVRLCTQHGIFESPFSAACFAATPSIISFLLEHGPHMQGHPATGRMPIHLAAANGPEVFQAILPLHVGDLTVVDNEGKSCLHWAAQFGNAQTLSLILSKLESFERIAEVSRPDRDGWTPLCWAARAYAEGGAFSSAARSEKPDFAATICSLLDHGASREVRCRWGEETLSPLELAEGYGAEEEIVRMLGKLISISDESNLSRSKEEVDDKNEAPRRFAETSKQCFYCFLVSLLDI